MGESILYLVFVLGMIGSATGVVLMRTPIHSLLFLIMTFFNAAGLFLVWGAEFLAMMLVIVYVGAVAVLFLFVVMIMNVDEKRLKFEFSSYTGFSTISLHTFCGAHNCCITMENLGKSNRCYSASYSSNDN